MEEVTVSARDEDYRGAADKVWDITHTKVKLSFNLPEKTANGEVWLDMHPYFYATDTLVLDAKGMLIDTVVVLDNIRQMPIFFMYDDDIIKVKLDRKIHAFQSINLYVKYTTLPGGKPTGGSKAIGDDRGIYFINTDGAIKGKPVQIWTQGETESNSHWMPTIDKPNERFTTEIELTVPDSFVTLSNGKLTDQVKLAGGVRTDRWVMDKEIQAYVVTFVVGNYAIIKDEWRGKEISYYVEPPFAPYAKQMFNNTPEMVEYFSGITGVPYPWNKYSQVVVRDYVSGAMENTTATTFGEFINQDFRQMKDRDYEYIVAHELFHQWFGDYVTAESWSNITVNESFANYGETLWRRYKYGKTAADDEAASQLWSYVYGQAASNDPALVRFRYKDREEVFDRVSYQKGGAILGYLHGLTGDSAFYKSMNIYLQSNALKSAEATNWRMAVEEATGQDWNWFFNQWYYKGGHPKLDLQYSYDDKTNQLIVTVKQVQEGGVYRLPLKTWIVTGTNVDIVDWDLRKREEVFKYSYTSSRPVVVADAAHWLVGDINYNLTPAQWLTVYKASSDNVVNRRLAISAAVKEIEDSNSQVLIDIAMNDSWHSIRQLALEYLSRIKGDQWKEKWKGKVWKLATHDTDNIVRATAFSLLGDWDAKEAKQDMLAAIPDSSYSVAGAALDALDDITMPGDDTTYKIAKEMLGKEPKGDLRIAIWEIIAEKGNASDAMLFHDNAWQFYGSSKIEFAAALSTYLEHVVGDSAFDTALSTMVAIHKYENISGYRSAIAGYLFKTAGIYKKMVANSRSNTEQGEMQMRYDKIKLAIDEVIQNEYDEKNAKSYRNYRRIIFGK